MVEISCEEITILLIRPGFGLSIKRGYILGRKESQREMVSIQSPLISTYWLNRGVIGYWCTCARAVSSDSDWFTKNHHAVRQAKRKTNMTYMKAYRKAQKEHRGRYQQDMKKLESKNTELR